MRLDVKCPDCGFENGILVNETMCNREGVNYFEYDYPAVIPCANCGKEWEIELIHSHGQAHTIFLEVTGERYADTE